MHSIFQSIPHIEQQMFAFLRAERKRYNEIVKKLRHTEDRVERGELKKQRRASQNLMYILVPAHRSLRTRLNNYQPNVSVQQVCSLFYRQLVDVLLGGVVGPEHPVWSLTFPDDGFVMHVREGKLKNLYARAGTPVRTAYMLDAYERHVLGTLKARNLGDMRKEYEKRTSDFARNKAKMTRALLERLRPVVSEEEYAILEEGLSLSLMQNAGLVLR